MGIPKRITWFLIIDSAKARIFESSGPNGAWNLVEESSDDDARRPSRDLGRDRPVRGRTIGTGAPFAVTENAEHEKAGRAFVAAFVDAVEEAGTKDSFDQLVIAAPPSALGDIRKQLSAQTTAKLIGAYDKDLTNESEQDLREYFRDKLERW